MLARIDPDKGVVDLISVPRDTMIDIEGHGTQKINAAYALRRPPPKAVKNALHLRGRAHHPLRGGALRRAEGRRERARRHSGELPESFYSDTSGISLEAGEQTLDGDQALAFARERHATPPAISPAPRPSA